MHLKNVEQNVVETFLKFHSSNDRISCAVTNDRTTIMGQTMTKETKRKERKRKTLHFKINKDNS